MITAIDFSDFTLHNVVDTCSLWNLLSSEVLYSTAKLAGCTFCCTKAVYYEAAIKQRSYSTPEAERLRSQFIEKCNTSEFSQFEVSIEDLQDLSAQIDTQRIGIGELSSIAFARKTGVAFLTDDIRASRQANRLFQPITTQNVPHLFGWLFFTSKLSDSDRDVIISEHKQSGENLEAHFIVAFDTALHRRLLATVRA